MSLLESKLICLTIDDLWDYYFVINVILKLTFNRLFLDLKRSKRVFLTHKKTKRIIEITQNIKKSNDHQLELFKTVLKAKNPTIPKNNK
ncbi:hypothetical protein BpHYR1_051550 [Brachionus plicatilis]|uniref:Uncharacterized protein n=1 Tax=Brachionus plicatilis TaxID=10195 RepID=A0A3M7Q1J6_BRAPC|nr:hypothetical protein BpHYR1_051550 [Brachionus plicatilis]